jgi:methionine synthase II (cobalamin-independent)
MKRSTDRILTTHVGSLARPDALIPFLRAKERAQPYDAAEFARLARQAVAESVRKQVEAGIDVPTDGEQGKASFFGYVIERFDGFERRPAAPGQESTPRAAGREYLAFPDYYAWSERIAEWAGGRGGDRRHGVDTCTGPIRYKGHAAVKTEIDNLRSALAGLPHEDVFMPAIAPSYIAATLPNEHYRTTAEYDIILKIDAGAYSFEAANPRHEHEYHVFERVKVPEGGILIPGVISHTTNLVEHPELIAERIERFATIVGRENVIAGADCGFAASAVRFNDTHPSVAWLKFAAMAEGARIATGHLWSR